MKELYTLNLDATNHVLSIAHTQNDNIELDLSLYDLDNLSCYQYIRLIYVRPLMALCTENTRSYIHNICFLNHN